MSRAPHFFVPGPFVAQTSVTVGEDAAHHMRVRRMGQGTSVVLLDGQGTRALGVLHTVSKRSATVDVHHVEQVPPAPEVHALVPIGDRDRMLWLGEKAAELGLTSWRPVLWKHSRSVAPGGRGPGFQNKLLLRMASAIEQSGNTWLPVVHPDAPLDRAISAVSPGARIVLDFGGVPMANAVAQSGSEAITIAIGPEGGFDEDERTVLRDAGFVAASLGAHTLRFETAGVVAIAHARARADSLSPSNHFTA